MTDDPLAHLGAVSRQYQVAVANYTDVATAAAEAEAKYKSARARKIVRITSGAEKVSHVHAETVADADEDIAALYLHRLVTNAKADAHKQWLAQLREQVQTGRTYVASAREVDKIHADGTGGAA